MSLDLMLKQRARVEQATPAVGEDGTVRRQWRIVADAEPCLVEKLDAAAEGLCRGRCYFSDRCAALTPGDVQGQVRVTVEGRVYYLRNIYRQGGGHGRGVLQAEVEL